jgi:hypothetical protein
LAACGDDGGTLPSPTGQSQPDMKAPPPTSQDMRSKDVGDMAPQADLLPGPDLLPPPDLRPAHSCTGTLDCSANILPDDCQNAGCVYSPDQCGGTAWSCFTINDSFTCSNQQGCVWSGTQCNGIATSCGVISVSQCADQSGCVYQTSSCTGPSPKQCSDFKDDVSCILAHNCNWQ